MSHLFAFARKPTILLADDTLDNLTVLLALFKDRHRLKRACELLQDRNRQLEQLVQERTYSLLQTQDVIRRAIASLANIQKDAPEIFDALRGIEEMFHTIAPHTPSDK